MRIALPSGPRLMTCTECRSDEKAKVKLETTIQISCFTLTFNNWKWWKTLNTHQPLGVWRGQIRLELPVVVGSYAANTHWNESENGFLAQYNTRTRWLKFWTNGHFCPFSPNMHYVGKSLQTHPLHQLDNGSKLTQFFLRRPCTRYLCILLWCHIVGQRECRKSPHRPEDRKDDLLQVIQPHHTNPCGIGIIYFGLLTT